MAWVIDLDGVVWLAHEPIAGSVAAIDRLRAAGHGLCFVTNNSQASVGSVSDRLRSVGIDPGEDDVITSAMAVAQLVEPGERVLAFAGPGVVEALERRGAHVVTAGPADAVVVGKHVDLSYERLRSASRAVRSGARFLATNTDPTYPTGDGLDPGAGALVAAVATAGGRQPDAVAGKPHEAMAGLVVKHLGTEGIVVGDVPSTDGMFAHNLRFRFALVLSGVTTAVDLPVTPMPWRTFDDLAAVVDAELG
jgi:HAD superfamily hydrolase (TIGR01450 family)